MIGAKGFRFSGVVVRLEVVFELFPTFEVLVFDALSRSLARSLSLALSPSLSFSLIDT